MEEMEGRPGIRSGSAVRDKIRSDFTPGSAWLLVGHPKTGKSTLGRAIAPDAIVLTTRNAENDIAVSDKTGKPIGIIPTSFMIPKMAGYALRKLVENNVSELIFDDAGQLYERHAETFFKVFDAIGNMKIRLLVMVKYFNAIDTKLREIVSGMLYRPPKSTSYINSLKAQSWPWVPLPQFLFYYVNGEATFIVDSRLTKMADCLNVNPNTCARCQTAFTPFEACRCGVCVKGDPR